MASKDYKRGFSAGSRNEHDISFGALMEYIEGLREEAKYADDPASLIARAEAVLYCMALLKRVGTQHE
jgi:hypothetical protein